MTDQTPEYQRLLSVGLVDAYRQAGWGFGFTFPAFRRVRFAGHQAVIRFPLVRIDYVLGAKIQAQRARVITESTGSDHRPVLAELAVGT
jgi:endonuclease/exonuclease/phosphatase (EEP) superfamily protein YafD